MKISTSQSYKTPGSYSWVCPTGVTWVDVELWGAGGGGGNGFVNSSGNTSGGGGGGYAKKRVTVTPGTTYTVVVGNTIKAPFSLDNTNLAGDSKFLDGSTVLALAAGGQTGRCSGPGTIPGGVGGGVSPTTTQVGDITYNGGNGVDSTGSPTRGGGAAGRGGNGSNTLIGNVSQGGNAINGEGRGGVAGNLTNTWPNLSSGTDILYQNGDTAGPGGGGVAVAYGSGFSDGSVGGVGWAILTWVPNTSYSLPQTINFVGSDIIIIPESGETAFEIHCWGGGSDSPSYGNEGGYDSIFLDGATEICRAKGCKGVDNSTGWVTSASSTSGATGLVTGDTGFNGGAAGGGGGGGGYDGGGGGGGAGSSANGGAGSGSTAGTAGSPDGGAGGSGYIKNGAAGTAGTTPGGGAGAAGSEAGGGGGGYAKKNSYSVTVGNEYKVRIGRGGSNRAGFSSGLATTFNVAGNGRVKIVSVGGGGGGSTVMPSRAAVVRQAVQRTVTRIVGKLRGLSFPQNIPVGQTG